MTGLHLSHYAIESELGRGGMGIVYRAKDTTLNRTVALKVLPAGALASEDDRARFRREAQAAAAITHPNVCHVYQVDEATPTTPDGKPVEGHMEPRLFIAMEYIDGETLHDYVKKGPLKLQEAVNIAGQVAEALKEAHAKDIVHRDIKSANVMLTEGGVAKVLDFGLAKTNQSTMLTRMGSTLGTVAYMSPEQARGQEVDGRSDLYSLGTMLYEMVAGRLPYSGDYEQAVLYGILNEAPEPLTAVRTGVPMQLEWVVNKLLAKEAEYRYQSAAGLLADLKSLDLSGSGHTSRSTPAIGTPNLTGPASAGSPAPRWIWAGLALALMFGAAIAWLLKPAPREDVLVRRFTADFEPAAAPMGRISLSADGRAMATLSFEEDGRSGVVRFFDEPSARILPVFATGAPPAISPDARWVAYHDNQYLYRVSTTGGSPEIIAEIDGDNVAWISDDEVVTDSASVVLYRVPEFGSPQRIDLGIPASDGFGHLAPVKGYPLVLYTHWSPQPNGFSNSVHVVDLETAFTRQLVPRASWGRYHTAGYLLFFRGGDIHAASFDPGSFEVGRSFVLQSGVATMGDDYQIFFDVSADVLAYYRSNPSSEQVSSRELLLLDGTGTTVPVDVDRKNYWDPRISPDGRLVLTHASSDATGSDIWLIDPARGTARRMTTNPGEDETALWSPGGTHFYYSANGDDTEYVLRQSVDGSTPIDTLLEDTYHKHVESVSRDERYLVISSRDDTNNTDLVLIDLTGGDSVRKLTTASSREIAGKISPDGRLLAYQSDESGRDEIYVAQFPSMLSVQAVSDDGGVTPVWSVDGRKLYYLNGQRLLGVTFSGDEPGAVTEVMTLPGDLYLTSGHTAYDVREGQFVFIRSHGGTDSYQTVQLIDGVSALLRSLDPDQ